MIDERKPVTVLGVGKKISNGKINNDA